MRRERYKAEIQRQFRVHSVCALLGPRQVGKTTLAKMYAAEFAQSKVQYFDLENPLDLQRLENPMLALSDSSYELVVIDEIQRRPDLFQILRVLVDEQLTTRKFLILGSASRDLISQSSETLAGRIGYIELAPFSLIEVPESKLLWQRGGFPRSYLAATNEESYLWRQAYISTFLERDIPNLGFQIPPQQMRRFWLMLAHYHGQIFNASELGRSFGISDHTARKYVEILEGTFMIRKLQPWFENLGKRQVKSPKIYFRDNGILFALLGLQSERELDLNPRLGSFWEGFALEETLLAIQAKSEECYFWGTHAGAELDLFVLKNGKRLGFEFKYADAPKMTASMHIALNDLQLDHLYIIFPGNARFRFTEKITAYGLQSVRELETLL